MGAGELCAGHYPILTGDRYVNPQCDHRRRGLSNFVDLSDCDDLFEMVTNEQVVSFSHAFGQQGFRSSASVLRATGVENRRICRRGIGAFQLAVELAERLRSRIGFTWRDCSAIGLSHTHTDPKAHLVLADQLHRTLGIPKEKLFAINFGCVGFLELLSQGMKRFDGEESGGPIALMAVETPDEWHDAADRSFSGIVSAGAAGCLIGSEMPHQMVDVRVDLKEVAVDCCDPKEILFWTETADVLDFRGNGSHRAVMRMNGGPVFLHGTELMIEACRLAWNVVSRYDRRAIVAPHQPSGKMLRAMFSVVRDEFPCLDLLNHLARGANSISATIPGLLAHLDEVLEEHQLDPILPGEFILTPAAGIGMAHRQTHMAQGWAVLEW